ncbi:MAG TPA: DUF6765 family protein [Rhodocyclaceae bacterium]|nr:DUF6765 family protein [Rhodocyclaceae bacterium]
MDIDFHYYMTKALAVRAGFQDKDAQDIAYANQYVDDGWDVIPAVIEGLPDLDFGELKLGRDIFDPVTTAHNDETIKGGALNAAQMNTYIPFHFIPAEEYKGSGDFDYRTQPNDPACQPGTPDYEKNQGRRRGSLARQLMEANTAEVVAARGNPELFTRKLIKLGIASHSFVDTWAHQNFSGRFSFEENNVTEMEHQVSGRSIPQKSVTEGMKANLLGTPIGHARAGHRPDMSHLVWSYRTALGRVERNNPDEYLRAAKELFHFLAQAAGAGKMWTEGLENDVRKCICHCPDGLTDDTYPTEMPKIYPTVFPDVNFKYDRNEWRSGTLEGELEKFGTADLLAIAQAQYRLLINDDAGARAAMPKLKYKQNHGVGMRWFYFHIEALAQRKFIKDRIKALPPSDAVEDYRANLKHVIESNLPRELEKAIGDSIVFKSYRAAFPVPKEITGKHRWIQVTIENRTMYDIVWTEKMKMTTGRFWVGQEPRTVLSQANATFGASNSDDSFLTGVGGAVMFSFLLDSKKTEPFVIAFSHPQESGFWSALERVKTRDIPERKCQATFGNELKAAWDRLAEGGASDSKVVSLSDGSRIELKLESKPGDKATITITQRNL